LQSQGNEIVVVCHGSITQEKKARTSPAPLIWEVRKKKKRREGISRPKAKGPSQTTITAPQYKKKKRAKYLFRGKEKKKGQSDPPLQL